MTRPVAPLPQAAGPSRPGPARLPAHASARPEAATPGPSVAASSEALGPGLHPVTLQQALRGERFRVATLAGQSLEAQLGDGVALALAEHCLSTGRFMLAAPSPRGLLLLGALQTELGPQTQPDGTLVIAAKRIELRADEELQARGGTSALKLQAEGKVRMNGHRLTIDMDANVRVLSALVELP